jgi:hypothetical protein
MQHVETSLLLQQTRYPQRHCKFFVARCILHYRGAICDASAAARDIFSHAREGPTAGKFTPRLPFHNLHRRRAISPPPPLEFAAAP